MASISQGHVARPRVPKKPNGGTPSSRRHRFESFSQRIAKLKIEPVRRGRSTIVDDAELDPSFSYFKKSFDEWRELNLSESFAAFARQVAPRCESLPQILHHHDRILDLLIQYIERGDTWSEEPLLSLMTHVARDLGVKFEQHFERVVTAVAHLAAKHQHAEVIEWSFTCLAWLFKYLSRLLVPDLRPLFDMMAPLLGKEHHKFFVTRFAAESLSFLVRKAAAVYHRDKAPLRLILKHISGQLHALQGSGTDHEFQHGLMALFADSMKGIQRCLHSSATAIMQEMLLLTYDEEYTQLRTAPLEPILTGVVISVIHHSDAENFKPLLDAIVHQVKVTSSDARFSRISARLLFVVCGVRKGSRVHDWKPILNTLSSLCVTLGHLPIPDRTDLENALSACAVVFQYCPLDTAIPYVQVLEYLSKGHWDTLFLPFCNLFADLGTERFRSLLLPYFKRFLTQKADDLGSEVCMVLAELNRNEALPQGCVHLSTKWYGKAAVQFQRLVDPCIVMEELHKMSYECNAILEASKLLDIPADIKDVISAHLFQALKHAVHVTKIEDSRPTDILATGMGFRFLVDEAQLQDAILDMLPSLYQNTHVYSHSLLFWQSLLSFAQQKKTALDISDSQAETIRPALMHCLGSSSHDMRLAGLGILEIIAGKTKAQRDIISTAIMIEQTPLDLENARSISMRIRQLAKSYPAVRSDGWLGEAIASFCFGVLHVRLAQAWDDTCTALKDMCETKEGEAYVSRIALEWLNGDRDAVLPDSSGNEDANARPQHATEFECTNLMQLERLILNSQRFAENVHEKLSSRFNAQHARIPFITPFSRTQALRLLAIVPQVAERCSRHLVPIILKWTSHQPTIDLVSVDQPDCHIWEDAATRWARKDQKALLSVFSKFTNPKTMFKSAEVYKALLVLLGNGDVEIQKAALSAIITWKDPAVVRYKENLFNLLDDARFREEISVFMDVGEEETYFRQEHRAQLLPIILEVLYGKVVSGKRGQEAKRKAVFIALTRFEENAIHQFLSIAFGPLGGISILKGNSIHEDLFEKDLMDPRKQVGMLNMLEDMLDTLKSTLKHFASLIVDPLLYCMIRASRCLATATRAIHAEEQDGLRSQLSLYRTVRQHGFHSLNTLFEYCPDFTWGSYMPLIVDELVNPRLQQLPVETAQSVSGLLRLFGTWSQSPLTAPYLVEHNPDILVKTVDCLEVPSAKDEVKRFVLDNVVRGLVETAADVEGASSIDEKLQRNRIHSEVLQPYANIILSRVGYLLRGNPSKDLLESSVHAVADLAPHVVGSMDSRSMIEIATFLLRQPSKRVSSNTKLGLLKILHGFIPRCDGEDLSELFDSIFDVSCSYLSYSQVRVTRALLCDVIQDLSENFNELLIVAKLCYDLNAYSTSRLDEPDFDRRSSAFSTINEVRDKPLSLIQWKPLVYNMLYYIRDTDELSIRVNSSLALRRFVEAAVDNDTFKGFLWSAVVPGIQSGMQEASELVRIEFLAVLAHLVKHHTQWPPIADLHVLLGPDEESSFFSNVLHLQGHRRLRALRRLASDARQLRASSIYHIILPLLEHFIFDKVEDENAHNLASEAIRTVSSLSEWLEWPQFRSALKRFIGYLASKEDMLKTIVKLLAGVMDSLNQAGRARGYIAGRSNGSIGTVPEEANSEDAMEVGKIVPTLAKTLPQQEKLTGDLTSDILPALTGFLHNKDESTVSLRVPVAIAVTKVLLVLPPREIEVRLPSVLLDICHILKSRSQDGRDMSRDTLAAIATLSGPRYLGFILKSLKTALQRGYQLHVLSFTLHHILVKLSPGMKPGDIDYCLPEIVDVIMDDIFGVTGQEKDAEEYISKMKEVKSSKSYDSMDIIARSATSPHLVDLIFPLKTLLLERLNGKLVQKIDELLRRIGLGILQNPTLNDRDILVFCYELIQEVYKAHATPEDVKQDDRKSKRYLVNMKGQPKTGVRGSASSYMYKITRFGLDVLRIILRKHDELQTPQNLALFLPIMGDALVQGHEEVQISAVRLLTTILRVPHPELDKNCPVYVTEAVRTIKSAPSTNTELAQASLKMISAVLRGRPTVTIKERDLAYLLKCLLPDLDEPDRQGVTFGFLKAIMTRKIVVAEVYEVMDKVAAMMVTNQTRSARDLARSSYFHFLMEYPQAKNRFNTQLEFLVRNLRYDYVDGRQSVMEALNLIMTRVGDDVLQDVLGMMFIPLVHTMANDDSSDCRNMAGALVKKLFERADSQRLKSFKSDLRDWLEQDNETGLRGLGIQCWGLYFETVDVKKTEVNFVLGQLQSIVEEGLARRDEDDWELIYYSLTVVSKLCKSSPETIFSASRQEVWATIRACASYPHSWVKITAARILGTLFVDLAGANGDGGLANLPLQGSHGLQLAEESMIQLTNASLKTLSNLNVSEELCTQIVRNLAFLARCLAANGAKWNWQRADDDEIGDTIAEEAPESTNGHEPSSDEEWGGFSPRPEPTPREPTLSAPTAVHRLTTRLSGLIRRETKMMKLTALYPKAATMTLLETLCSKLPISSLSSSLPHLLNTLSTLTDPATTVPRSSDPTFNESYKALIGKAHEILTTLQRRMGSRDYLSVMGDVQKGTKQRREARKTKRKIEAVTMPEKFEREKKRRHDVSRQRRKEKSAENRGRRRGW